MESQKLCFATDNNLVCLSLFKLGDNNQNQQLSTQISLSNVENNSNNSNNILPPQITTCPGPNCPESQLIQIYYE